MPDDVRSRLVAAGVGLVAEQGIQALSLREIARRAGVSHGAPRRYFPTHRELLAAVARVGYDRLTARIGALDRHGDPRRDLLALGRLYLDFARADRGMFELMFRYELLHGNREGLRAAGKPLFGVLVSLLPDRPTTLARAGAFWATLHGIAQLSLWGTLDVVGSGDPDALLSAAVDAYVED